MTYDPRGLVRAPGRAVVARVDAQIQDAAGAVQAPAAQADTIKEASAVSHDITHEHTTQGRQMIAALALAHLLEQDLPAATWTLYTATPGELDGQIDRHTIGTDHDPAIRAAVEEWAEFLRGDVQTRPYVAQPGVGAISVTGTYRGVHVRIWAQVSIPAGRAGVAR